MAVHQETDPGSSGPVSKIWFWCFMFFMLLKMKMPIALLQSDMAMEKWWNMWVDNLVTCHCSLNDYLAPKMFLYMMSIHVNPTRICCNKIRFGNHCWKHPGLSCCVIRASWYVIVYSIIRLCDCICMFCTEIMKKYYVHVFLHMGTHDDQPCDVRVSDDFGQIHIRSYVIICMYIYTHICCGLSGTFKKNAFGEPEPL